MAAASCGGIFLKNSLFESSARLEGIFSQWFEDKGLLCISVVAVEKPGRSVILTSL